MNQGLAAFVITFRRPQVAAGTVRRLLLQSRPPDHVLVVDNGASPETADAVRSAGRERVTYQPLAANPGPAGAAAHALARLRDQGFAWILWVDDDNPPRTDDTLARLWTLIATEAGPDVAGVAAVGSRWDWRRGETRRLRDDELTGGPCEVDVAGGGQNLIVRSSVLGDDRLPDPDLFFGLEEFAFCLRLRLDGYRLLVDGPLMREYRRLAGRLGHRARRRPGRRYPPHALWRRYYTTRNYIHLMRTTFGRSDLARREMAKALARCVAAWGGGPSYGWRFTRVQLAGVRDGLRGRMGRTLEPAGYPATAGTE